MDWRIFANDPMLNVSPVDEVIFGTCAGAGGDEHDEFDIGEWFRWSRTVLYDERCGVAIVSIVVVLSTVVVFFGDDL